MQILHQSARKLNKCGRGPYCYRFNLVFRITPEEKSMWHPENHLRDYAQVFIAFHSEAEAKNYYERGAESYQTVWVDNEYVDRLYSFLGYNEKTDVYYFRDYLEGNPVVETIFQQIAQTTDILDLSRYLEALTHFWD